jgi:hypothetical protein
VVKSETLVARRAAHQGIRNIREGEGVVPGTGQVGMDLMREADRGEDLQGRGRDVQFR